jgi:hypothetical protein
MSEIRLSRRSILRSTSGAFGVTPVVGTTSGEATGNRGRCPEATVRPEMKHCAGANVEACADDHPETQAIQDAVSETLETRYPDVGTLIDEEFVPYFDLAKSGEEGGYSHWLSPDFLGDETVLDPDRPESVLVDNKWWRPIGVMFIATEGGEPVEDPPAVYGEGETACSPWHYHVGVPGRFAWWYYQQVYAEGQDPGLRLPCRTPCMLHVWTYPNPNGVYAHGPPPRGNRGGPPAEDPGFETAAVPGEDRLSQDVLPDDFVSQFQRRGSLRDLLFG